MTIDITAMIVIELSYWESFIPIKLGWSSDKST